MSERNSSLASVAIATWFGCGFFPVAPGTVGSLAAVGIAVVCDYYFPLRGFHLWVAALALILPGVWASNDVCRAQKREDPGLIVVDEVIGQWITLGGALSFHPKSWLLGFALFRILDVWKPFPARNLEAWHGGKGVVADDVMAGIYGALIMYLAGYYGLY